MFTNGVTNVAGTNPYATKLQSSPRPTLKMKLNELNILILKGVYFEHTCQETAPP